MTECPKCGKVLFPNAADWQVETGLVICRGDCGNAVKSTRTEAPLPQTPKYANVQKPAHRGANKTETLYGERLHAEMLSGRIRSYEFESITLKLGPDSRYTPDYVVISDCVELHEVKGGYAREDAMAKLRAASGRFPYFKFILAKYEDGCWTIKEL